MNKTDSQISTLICMTLGLELSFQHQHPVHFHHLDSEVLLISNGQQFMTSIWMVWSLNNTILLFYSKLNCQDQTLIILWISMSRSVMLIFGATLLPILYPSQSKFNTLTLLTVYQGLYHQTARSWRCNPKDFGSHFISMMVVNYSSMSLLVLAPHFTEGRSWDTRRTAAVYRSCLLEITLFIVCKLLNNYYNGTFFAWINVPTM